MGCHYWSQIGQQTCLRLMVYGDESQRFFVSLFFYLKNSIQSWDISTSPFNSTQCWINELMSLMPSKELEMPNANWMINMWLVHCHFGVQLKETLAENESHWDIKYVPNRRSHLISFKLFVVYFLDIIKMLDLSWEWFLYTTKVDHRIIGCNLNYIWVFAIVFLLFRLCLTIATAHFVWK